MGRREDEELNRERHRELIVDEYKNGESYVIIAKRYNVGQGIARRIIQEAGIEIRPVARPAKIKKCQRCGESREKNLETLQAKAREKNASVKRFTDAVKLTSGCVDCGYNERAIALDFDHLPNYEKTQIVAHCKTIRRAMIEIEKCEVVCANCHRIRTEDRGNYGKRNCDC